MRWIPVIVIVGVGGGAILGFLLFVLAFFVWPVLSIFLP